MMYGMGMGKERIVPFTLFTVLWIRFGKGLKEKEHSHKKGDVSQLNAVFKLESVLLIIKMHGRYLFLLLIFLEKREFGNVSLYNPHAVNL